MTVIYGRIMDEFLVRDELGTCQATLVFPELVCPEHPYRANM